MSMRRNLRLLQLAALPFALAASTLSAQTGGAACSNTYGTITVPKGFCIELAADSLDGLRHIAVAANGDLYAAVGGGRGGLFVLHDRNKDGVFEARAQLFPRGGNDVVLRNATTAYFTTNDAILRLRLADGDRVLGIDTIVEALPVGGHVTKSIAFDGAGNLYLDIGSRTNSCQVADRTNNSPGVDPCVELETRAGVWRFDANKLHQKQADGTRFATGLRNVVALTSDPVSGRIYGVQHGRDQLAVNWGFTNEQSAELPSEIFVQMNQGDDFGWPYCYHDRFQNKTVLAPEYGGDGKAVGRCASKKQPIAAYPGHWAPEAVVFYTGTAFPARFRSGAFISFHGSWNRAPLPQAGFNVIFQPLDKAGAATGKYTVFAEGFDKMKVNPTSNAIVQPMGLAVGPDGSLYIGADRGGKVWRVRAQGGR